MTTNTTLAGNWTMVLRRQPARIVSGAPEDRYTSKFEIICRDCGDDLERDYRDVSPQLQRIRGPYWLTVGITKYGAHIEWHEANQASTGLSG